MPLPPALASRSGDLPSAAQSINVGSADFTDAGGFMIRVGGAGTVTYRAIASRQDVAETFAAGDLVPVILSAVRATGTSATGLVAYHWRQLYGQPSAPRNVAATAGVEQVSLAWAAPSDDGGDSIVRYEVRQGTGAWESVGLVLARVVTGLTAGTAASFAVRAVNRQGEIGAASAAVSATPTAPPSP